MNQILVTNLKKSKYKKIFKFQFILSILITIISTIYLIYDYRKTENMEYISEILNNNIKISGLYQTQKISTENSVYLGKIIIEKIKIEYPIFSTFDENLMKIAPCRFYGVDIGETGNICIAGHNYNDTRFFSRIGELRIKDEIKLIDLNEKEYTYIVFDIFETEDTNISSVIRKKKQYELTLLTCNNSNYKRVIVKAFKKTE